MAIAMLRGIATLVGLRGTWSQQATGEAEEDDFEAYLETHEGPRANSDADNDDDLGGLVQAERDRTEFPPDDIPVEAPEIRREIPGESSA